jgi:hypothetical protein
MNRTKAAAIFRGKQFAQVRDPFRRDVGFADIAQTGDD